MKKKFLIGIAIIFFVLGFSVALFKKGEEIDEYDPVTFTLSSGHYTAGIDIPEGKYYTIVAKNGYGTVSTNNTFTRGIKKIMSDREDGIAKQKFKNLNLEYDDVLTITSALTIEMSSKKAKLNRTAGRNMEGEEKILKPGHYIAEKDFLAGVYDIIWIEGSGNVFSSNKKDDGLNEVFGEDSTSIKEFKNCLLDDKTELTVNGVIIKITPSQDYFINE